MNPSLPQGHLVDDVVLICSRFCSYIVVAYISHYVLLPLYKTINCFGHSTLLSTSVMFIGQKAMELSQRATSTATSQRTGLLVSEEAS